MFEPVIKWSGSKRSQAPEIIQYFPDEINTYFEPFLGGGSVFRALLESDKKVKKYVLSDNNADLMQLWEIIANCPEETIKQYREYWNAMNQDVPKENQKYRQDFYNIIREGFNKTRNPYAFMFLNRTCFNGLIRYNSENKFNSPFHLNRNGILPDKFAKIVTEWNHLINDNNVTFICCTYEEIKPEEGDFIYLDPPYANTKGMYQEGSFDNQKMFEWMRNLPCGYALSYDGLSGNQNKTFNVPKDIYKKHHYIRSGNSSFKRITESNKNAEVYESIYLK